jgi:hypothetical protein
MESEQGNSKRRDSSDVSYISKRTYKKNLGIRNIGDDVEDCQMKWKHPDRVHKDRIPNLFLTYTSIFLSSFLSIFLCAPLIPYAVEVSKFDFLLI